ncbi:MAG: hypothetical protein ACLTSG_09950 [Lachnospiraceae bacterium]
MKSDPDRKIVSATQIADFYANISNGFNRVTAMYEAFDYAKGTTATVSLENEISLAAGGERGETVVIDDPNSNITVASAAERRDCQPLAQPCFRRRPPTPSAFHDPCAVPIEASGDTHVAVENCKVISGASKTSALQVFRRASSCVDSNISKYHTAIKASRQPREQDYRRHRSRHSSQAIRRDGASYPSRTAQLPLRAHHPLLQADDFWASRLYVICERCPPRSQAGGGEKGMHYEPASAALQSREGALTIGGSLEDGFHSMTSPARSSATRFASQLLNDSQTYSVGR